MRYQDEDIIRESVSLIHAFKKHLEFINAYSLSMHLVGVIRKGWVCYRDPDNNWYHKDFCADIDDELKEKIGVDKNSGHYYVATTEFRDYYLYDLINSFRIETQEMYNAEIDEKKVKELERQWKSTITEKYNIDEHIRRFIWELEPFLDSQQYGHLRDRILELFNEQIPNNTDVYSFVYCGLSYKCLDYKYPDIIHVAIKRAVGLWGNYVHYGRDKAIRLDQKTIEIPPYVYAPGFKKCTITEISKGLFESLKDVEIIRLPKTINKIEWSFWNCRNLRSIDVAIENKNYSSLDGVLYSNDRKVLFAYPCSHGQIFEVPEGVEIIEKFAFKGCVNLEMLVLPSTIKRIKLNAFYRSLGLKKIICLCKKENFVNEGFYGEYGEVNPQWYYIS